MFGLLNSTQIYGIQSHHKEHEQHYEITFPSTPKSSTSSIPTHSVANNPIKHHRTSSSVSDSGASSNKFLSTLTTKSPSNFLEKLLKTDLLNSYDTLRNYRNYPSNHSQAKRNSDPLQQQHQEGISYTFNCLQGSYRHSFDGEFYEKVHLNKPAKSGKNIIASNTTNLEKSSEMTIKCSKNLLAVEPEIQGPATLQNYQKIPESEHDLLVDSLVASSGASSGEFNSSDTTTTTQSSSAGSGVGGGGGGSSSFSSTSSNLYKRLSFGGRSSQNSQKQEKNPENAQAQQQFKDVTTDNSITLNLSSSVIPNLKMADLHRSSSSNSSSGDCLSKRERKKGVMTPQPQKTPLSQLLSLASNAITTSNASSSSPPPNLAVAGTSVTSTPNEKSQRRKLLQMLAHYDQQNKLLQRELAKEKRRRSDELACVVKSLLCFESKLKTDMKSVNQRLQDKDVEICRLVRQNRALRKKLCKLQEEASECTRDEGVVEDGEAENEAEAKDLLEDCLIMEALQCINCRRQFYDIVVQESCTQTTLTIGTGSNGSGNLKDASGSRKNDDPTTEHGSSSDDTISSSFFGARRSVRYTSKRTSGTFRDYMRSRAMNIDDPSLEGDNNSEEYPSTISRDDSHEKLNIYSRTIERMHGVKCESERDSEHSGLDTSSLSVTRSNSRASTKSSKSSSSKASELSNALEEDDGIFSPTQDEDFDEDDGANMELGKLKIVRGRALEAFSEASPKQVYETSTDDWYASASDQEEISAGTVSSKSYGQGAVNPVLECVNQILLQQSMEGIEDRSQTPKNSTTTLPRRSSLSDRRNNRCNSRASDGAAPNSQNGTLTRKRVHFSTKNSMVHVPRNDETEEEDEENDGVGQLKSPTNMISTYQGAMASAYTTHTTTMDKVVESERSDIFNYESIYSNEYEPIGSELNSSNLYVDMDSSTTKSNETATGAGKLTKLPPALPPKPANLLKFKKSLQQLDESPDELNETHDTEILVEPDYCSISEVNVGITSVQIRADIHRAPLSEKDLESVAENENDNDNDAATVISEANSQKTEEIEEIFADVPKLPNVEAIIAPKSALKQNDYLIMTPKSLDNNKVSVGIMALTPTLSNSRVQNSSMQNGNGQKPDRSSLKLNLSSLNGSFLTTPIKSPKMDNSAPLRVQLSSANYQQQYKRKHMPNILQEINKRLSLPNSPITSTPPSIKMSNSYTKSSANEATESLHSLPLQAEFDWYNLDAEYGKNTELNKVSEVLGNGMSNSLLADIKEDGESLITIADEYNLDEEYANEIDQMEENSTKLMLDSDSLNEAINPIITNNQAKAKKMKKNLANFEKFIENTGLVLTNQNNTKPLPSKRKIYFAGPFV